MCVLYTWAIDKSISYRTTDALIEAGSVYSSESFPVFEWGVCFIAVPSIQETVFFCVFYRFMDFNHVLVPFGLFDPLNQIWDNTTTSKTNNGYVVLQYD